jgi:hypothetical protein
MRPSLRNAGQQAGRPQHIAHGIKLDDQHSRLDLFIISAPAFNPFFFVPDAGPVAKEVSAFRVNRHLFLHGGTLYLQVTANLALAVIRRILHVHQKILKE